MAAAGGEFITLAEGGAGACAVDGTGAGAVGVSGVGVITCGGVVAGAVGVSVAGVITCGGAVGGAVADVGIACGVKTYGAVVIGDVVA